MSFKSKALITAATLTVVGGLTSAATLSASAATPECGDACISIFSRILGTNVVETVLDGEAKVGQPVILSPASSSDPSQDFFFGLQLVSDFFEAGMVSAEVNSHFGSRNATQIEFAPFGDDSDLCVGLETIAFQNEGLTLQPCTAPGTTVWIVDTPNPEGFFTIVNGSTTDFSRPFAMTYPQDQQAAEQRIQQITIRRLQFLSNAHTVPDRQLWSALFGVLP